jgi:hypothetical protein
MLVHGYGRSNRVAPKGKRRARHRAVGLEILRLQVRLQARVVWPLYLLQSILNVFGRGNGLQE